MARRKNYKVGDRIFWENFDGGIGTAIIKEIREESSAQDMYGKPLPEYKRFRYKVYRTGEYTAIEDYNCLCENDHRVKEFCKGKKFITINFVNELRQWLIEHGAHKGDGDVVQVLNDMSEEFE